MICTEDEAKTKWCHRTPRAVAPGQPENVSTLCLGSLCMAWNWKDESAGRGYCGLTEDPHGQHRR